MRRPLSATRPPIVAGQPSRCPALAATRYGWRSRYFRFPVYSTAPSFKSPPFENLPRRYYSWPFRSKATPHFWSDPRGFSLAAFRLQPCLATTPRLRLPAARYELHPSRALNSTTAPVPCLRSCHPRGPEPPLPGQKYPLSLSRLVPR